MTHTTLKKVYRYTPSVNLASTKLNSKIIGGEGTLWTEYVKDEKQLFRQLKPRVSALAESLWGTNTDFQSFKHRLP